MRRAGIARGRQSTAGQAAQTDGHQPLHDEESRHVPRALVVKDGLTADVPTVTPAPAVTFASDPEQSTVLAISVHDPFATPLLHPASQARVVHGSQTLPDVSQGESPLAAFVSANDEQDAKHGVVRETVDLILGWAWQEESPIDEGAGTGVGRNPRWTDAAEASRWCVLGRVLWVRVFVFEED